jgi:hypothetical protein
MPTSDPNDQPVSVLRAGTGGASGEKVRQVTALVVLAALAIVSVVFFLGGVHSNNQINDIRQHGVPVNATVTGCIGLLGGSGSNAAGYNCKGSFTLNGHHYTEPLPGSTLEKPGTVLHEVTVASDPGLLETQAQVATEHASGKRFIVPAISAVLFVLLGATIVVRTRRGTSTA